MVSMRSLALTAASLLLSASTVMGATTPTRVKRAIGTVSAVATVAIPGETMSSMGCFSSSEGLTWTFSYNYMSSAQCQIACLNNNLPVVGLSAKSDCYCGSTAPPKSALVSSSHCDQGCDGYGEEMCGGANTTDGGVYLTVYNDQLDSAEPAYFVSSSSSAISSTTSIAKATSSATKGSSEATSTVPAVVTVSGQVIYVTPSSAAAAASSSASSAAAKSHKSSTVGIAVGVVVGVVGAAALAGAIFFFIRRHKRRELEEEHKRQVAQSAYLNAKPGSAGGDSLPDSRLDPAVLRERRLSDGSIMDNQDYSRRILQVRNL